MTYILENSNTPQNLPDLIFLDIQMPFIDGWQFLDHYIGLTLPKPITIYVVSSSISSLDHEKSHQYTIISDFIVKPFSKNKILDVLHTHE